MKPHDMGVLFDECAQRRSAMTVHLDRPFDIAPEAGTRHTVEDLAKLVREAAGWLSAAGVGRGDRVVITKDNHWDYDLLACAAVRIGAIPAQYVAGLAPSVLETLVRRVEPALLVTTSTLLAEATAAGFEPLTWAERVLVLDGEDVDRWPDAIGLDQVRGHAPPAPRSRADDDPLVIHHTSGTTGAPKLVLHSTRTIIGKLARFESVRAPRIGLRRTDVVANASSYAHGRTFCWTGVVLCMAPSELLILSGQDADVADPLLREHPPTVVEALPSTFVGFQPLTERLDNPFRRTRLFISTYDAMHPPTIGRYLHASRHRSPLWMQGWGQTETGPLTFRFHTRRSLVRDHGALATARDLGRPVPFKTRLRVVHPDTLKPVRRGEPGLLLVRTAALCVDYPGERERYRDKHLGKWWNTGDIGVRRRDGSLLLLDREVDRVPDLSCLETEDVLESRLAGAVECVVLACPSGAPLPVVVTASGELDDEEWTAATRDLPELREPVALTWEQLPRTGTGKVRRRELLRQLTGTAETFGSGRWT